MRSDIIAILDIGSSKIVCLIAEVDPSGRPRIIGIGHQVSQGIRGGMVIDIKQAETAIVAAVHAAEKMAGETIDRVFINVSGGNLTSRHLKVETNISGLQVTDKDIQHIVGEGVRHFSKDDFEVLHKIPVDYSIDDAHGIRDPRGMTGEKLSTNLHVITASMTAVKNLANCLARCHLDIEDCIASPYASGIACLTEDEKNLGVVLLDIGGGNTSISAFINGNIIYTNNVALGGQHVTRDIARGLSTSLSAAERIKTLYGSATAVAGERQEVIDVPVYETENAETADEPLEHMHISRAGLTAIIRPRMEEILELVKKKLEASDFAHEFTGARLVLTGGSAQMAGIKELASEVFGSQARVGKPQLVEGMADATKGPAFSAAVGMLKYALIKDGMLSEEQGGGLAILSRGPIGKLVQWFQENF